MEISFGQRQCRPLLPASAATMTRRPQTGDCDCDRNFAASIILTLMYSAGHNRISHVECRL